ncbi:unnamed protein product, partial [marine sediment metagenome]
TEYNRYFISRHLELDGQALFVVESKKMAREIKALVNKEFVVEPNRKETLRRRIKEGERELSKIKHEEEKERKLEREEQMKADQKVRIVKEKPKEEKTQTVLNAPEIGV